MSKIIDRFQSPHITRSLPRSDARFMRSLIGHLAAINQFYRLPPLSRKDVASCFVRSSRDEIAGFLPKRSFVPSEQRRVPEYIYVPSQRKIYYSFPDSYPLHFRKITLSHEYLHLVSHQGERLGIINHGGGCGVRLNEGLTEFLVQHYWETCFGITGLKEMSVHQFEMGIIEVLIKKWGIKIDELADAYFNQGYVKLEGIVDAKLGEGAASMIDSSLEYPWHLLGVKDGFGAILTVKYGLAEAERRLNLLVENWMSYPITQREQVKKDTNELDVEMPLGVYEL